VLADGMTAAEKREAERTAWVRHPGMVLRTGRVLHVPDVSRDAQHLSRSSARSFTVRSRLFFPVRAASGGVGAVGLSSSRPDAFGEQHATLLALTTELAGSVYQRLATEHALRGRDAMLSALARGSGALLQAEDQDLALVALLRDLGEGLGLTRVHVCSIARGEDRTPFLQPELEWQAEGARRRAPAPEVVEQHLGPATYREMVERLDAGEVVGGRLADLPEALRPWLDAQGVRSILVAPVRLADALWGAACLEDARRPRFWSPHEADALRAVASTIGTALQRREDQRSLDQSEARYRAALEEQTELVCRTDASGAVLFANGAFCRFFGLDHKTVVGARVRSPGVLEPPYASACGFVMVDRPRATTTTEERQDDAAGQSRWIQWTDRPVLDAEGSILGCLSVGRDITDAQRARAEKDHVVSKLRSALEGTAAALSQLVEQRDPYTAGHQRRVAALAAAIGRAMDLDDDRVAGVTMGALVHDLGKISVPVEILSKPGPLAAVERRLMEAHPETAWQILAPLDFPWPVAEMVRQHHERMDGKGYPRGLRGEAILFEARIIAVADSVEAISSNRPYRPARGLQQALEHIAAESGASYDRAVVQACLRLMRQGFFRFPDP